ncbi:unnamed protein product [Protopolystoma xenopodis]|uniref:Uncharacterized protein n=1 Tax=Protopolystoma xenopodis TaxID=117903 RepID=A0A3S4ZS99_9PLAT|nr:unnamed protein product [Protopolystoma xenopodis]
MHHCSRIGRQPNAIKYYCAREISQNSAVADAAISASSTGINAVISLGGSASSTTNISTTSNKITSSLSSTKQDKVIVAIVSADNATSTNTLSESSDKNSTISSSLVVPIGTATKVIDSVAAVASSSQSPQKPEVERKSCQTGHHHLRNRSLQMTVPVAPLPSSTAIGTGFKDAVQSVETFPSASSPSSSAPSPANPGSPCPLLLINSFTVTTLPSNRFNSSPLSQQSQSLSCSYTSNPPLPPPLPHTLPCSVSSVEIASTPHSTTPTKSFLISTGSRATFSHSSHELPSPSPAKRARTPVSSMDTTSVNSSPGRTLAKKHSSIDINLPRDVSMSVISPQIPGIVIAPSETEPIAFTRQNEDIRPRTQSHSHQHQQKQQTQHSHGLDDEGHRFTESRGTKISSPSLSSLASPSSSDVSEPALCDTAVTLTDIHNIQEITPNFLFA